MDEGHLSLQAQLEEGEGGMRQQQFNSKKILIAPFINHESFARHIKAELGSEMPQLGFQEYHRNWVSRNTTAIGFPGIPPQLGFQE